MLLTWTNPGLSKIIQSVIKDVNASPSRAECRLLYPDTRSCRETRHDTRVAREGGPLWYTERGNHSMSSSHPALGMPAKEKDKAGFPGRAQGLEKGQGDTWEPG